MLFEILTSSIMLCLAGAGHYYKTNSINETKKILLIADRVGLYKDDEKLRIYRRTRNKEFNYTEYVFKVPYGLGFEDFQKAYSVFKDGLNNKSKRQIELQRFKGLKFDKTLSKQIKDILDYRMDLKKELEMEYDGMLRMRVFDHGIADRVDYDKSILKRVKNWEVPIGFTHKEFIKHDFEKMPILLVAGMTRYGKTVFLKNVVTTLIHNEPDNLSLSLVDLKGGLSFARYRNCKQVKSLAKNANETLETLEALEKELIRRQELFLRNGWEDIKEANWKERHVVIVDEGAEITGFDSVQRDRAQYLVGEIARIGAGLGFRLIFCTQYPLASVFPSQVKANTSAALCFKLKTATQSGVVLDKNGAEDLPVGIPGRGIYQSDQERIVQSPYIDNSFIDTIIKPHITINFKSRSEIIDESKTTGEDESTGKYITIFEDAGLSN
ncbi:FtsK/SpoIIIE domain-containing protein [Niallia taxi]|uniref:FtsK/SpoIIIE domain-containing protein n=1 Tax=Niallia taxi TaxID=2499688 RepID=UPI00293440B2|nr:FtsK/SpoIIIE domain-containing protein [Niallia taxi]WOD61746.1 FtsK/SpoIIIE domain-containing protein [Niallia taxi]